MVFCLPSDSQALSQISLVRDLKMLWRAIEPNHPNLRMKTQAAKNKWVDAVCLALSMPGLVRCLPRAPTHQSYVPVRPCAIVPLRFIPDHTGAVHPPISVPPSQAFIPPPIMLPPMVEPSVDGLDCPFERSLQFMFGDADMVAPPIMPLINSQNNNIHSGQKRKREEVIYLKSEPGLLHYSDQQHGDPDDMSPRTLQESAMLHQLRQMGFSDEQEMLAGIRHVSSQDLNKRVDDAMMWIVHQREETEEAKKMDTVRARSEQLRQEQAELKRKYKEERMDAATMEEWGSEREFFHGSVVLQGASGVLESLRATVSHKQILVDFLELEKNARKWYGSTVPYCYFAKRSNEWSNTDVVDLVDAVKHETCVVQSALFSLSEQQGGVPKVFSTATKDFEELGLPTGPDGRADDDEVIVIEELFKSEAASSNEDFQQEVIEIDL
jgi:hypothetical protein